MAQEAFGQIGEEQVQAITLHGAGGARARIITHGARLTELWVPDRAGQLADIVLGHDSAEAYAESRTFLGATCGRFSNRIAGGRFSLDGVRHDLLRNEGSKQLHGGPQGFDRKAWQVAHLDSGAVTLQAVSAAGEMGYPGRLELNVRYSFDPEGRFWIAMEAETDAPTVVNMVNHSYFNMAGHASGPVMDQHLRIGASHYTPVDDDLIPTGEIRSVAGTPFDFSHLRPISAALPGPLGFDHNLCLTGEARSLWGETLRFCAEALDPASGRRMQVWTTEPGVQFYTGGYLAGGPLGKGGAVIDTFSGFTLETQRFPDAPNRPQFPSARLDPGQRYRHLMAFDFTPAAAMA